MAILIEVWGQVKPWLSQQPSLNRAHLLQPPSILLCIWLMLKEVNIPCASPNDGRGRVFRSLGPLGLERNWLMKIRMGVMRIDYGPWGILRILSNWKTHPVFKVQWELGSSGVWNTVPDHREIIIALEKQVMWNNERIRNKMKTVWLCGSLIKRKQLE